VERGRPPLPLLLGIALLSLVAIGKSGQIRERAADGLGQGMPSREAALARGFVLGEDEEIDEGTKEDFRRAGLSHLLAVSGQNVTLLALLAMPVLGALGIPLRLRLFWVLGLIAVYVPVAGAGPSIQRAGVMGALGLLATLAGRRSSRFYALVVAAALTLAIDPGIAADIGWQLSFAAVLGILILAAPLARAIVSRIGSGPWRHALADGIAMTIASALATAPLIAFHFETLSTTTLVANAIALPAVAPAMWLGMCAAGLAQVPGVPLEPLNGLDALLLAYIAQVASWCAAPEWAELRVHLDGRGLAAAYLVLGLVILVWHRWPRQCLALAAAALALWLPLPSGIGDGAATAAPAHGLRVEVLDVGQGDAILLQPAAAPAVLVDGGPPGEGLERKLEQAGVEDLGAAVVTHDQSDHAGGIEELLGAMPVERLLIARASRRLVARASAAGAMVERVAAGREMRSGPLRLQVLWPPPDLVMAPGAVADPNQLALVIEARWGEFSMLLTADAEAEAVPLDPGPVDVLKVAHHGSDDAGLAALLERTRPQLALISVGEGNPYGHPTAATLATLKRHGVPTLRTDEDGTVVIDVDRRSFRLDG
jgi:competence protein ComEC